MTESTPTASLPAPLLDGSCNHWVQHGHDLHEFIYETRAGVERGTTCLQVRSVRHGRAGGNAWVRLALSSGALNAAYRLTADDAEAVARWLLDAAAMAREVTALVEAGACK